MNRLRETLNPDDQQFADEGSTRYKTEKNKNELRCIQCGELYYVDDATLRKTISPLEGDASEISFYCNDCEEEYQEEAYAK
jgi:hypothetical protein